MIRAAEIRTSNGMILQRAVQHLYPLEVRDDQEMGHGNTTNENDASVLQIPRPRREAAVEAKRKIRGNFV